MAGEPQIYKKHGVKIIQPPFKKEFIPITKKLQNWC